MAPLHFMGKGSGPGIESVGDSCSRQLKKEGREPPSNSCPPCLQVACTAAKPPPASSHALRPFPSAGALPLRLLPAHLLTRARCPPHARSPQAPALACQRP